MNKGIDIMWLMPERIGIKVWDDIYDVFQEDGKYTLNMPMNNGVEADNIYIYVNDKLFDTIDRRIALRAWDTLHLEYSIYAE